MKKRITDEDPSDTAQHLHAATGRAHIPGLNLIIIADNEC